MRSRSHVRTVLPLVALVLTVLAASLLIPATASAAREVRVGTYDDPPLVSLDARGNPVGLYIDILQQVAARNGWQLSYVNGSWSENLAWLRSGKIDLVLDMAQTPRRLADFSLNTNPIVPKWSQIWVRQGSAIKTVRDLAGQRVAVNRGDVTSAAMLALAHQWDVRPVLVIVGNTDAELDLLSRGEVAAAATDNIAGVAYKDKHGLLASSILFAPFTTGFGTAKGKNLELLAAVDRYVAEEANVPSSAYNRALARWLQPTPAGQRKARVPAVLIWSLVGTAVLAALLFAASGVFRRQVRRKTRELTNQNAALLESEQRLRLAQQAGGLGVFDADLASGVHHWDARTREIWGFGSDEPVSDETFLAGVHPSDREQLRTAMEGPLDPHAEPTFTAEYRVINRRDGVERWVSVFGTTLFEEGRAVRTVGFVAEISERKRAEVALLESEARYRSVVENDPVGVFQSTFENQLVFVNSAYANIFGYASPTEMIELVNRSGAAQTFFEDPGERLRLLQEVHAAAGEWVGFKHRYRRKGGSLFDGLLRVCERSDPASGAAHVFGFIEDVTAQEQATRALERAAELLNHGERLARVGSWEWDIASGSCAASAEWQRMHGLRGVHFSDERALATCHPDDREAMRAALARTAAGEPYRVDHRIVRPDTHEVRHLMTYGEPLFDADGRLETVIGASLDVTERVRADAVLLERETRLQHALTDTVAALGATVAMRDPYTSSHERRVAELAGLIAERLDWSAEAVERLRLAALVHDVGKIAVPAEILSKPSRLTEIEFALIKAHSAAAYEILAPIDFGGPVAEIVLQHHERLDGSGYPQGLSGDEILPGARLLAVADVVEAMITHRPYRPALPLEEALAEIEGGAGSRYDADACAVAVRLFRAEGFTFTE